MCGVVLRLHVYQSVQSVTHKYLKTCYVYSVPANQHKKNEIQKFNYRVNGLRSQWNIALFVVCSCAIYLLVHLIHKIKTQTKKKCLSFDHTFCFTFRIRSFRITYQSQMKWSSLINVDIIFFIMMLRSDA